MKKTVDIVMCYTDAPGGRYDKLAKALKESVRRNFPAANLIVDKNYPLDDPRYGGVPHNAMAYRWCEIAQTATRPMVFIGCDTLVLRDFSEVFRDDFALGVTVRDTDIPLNNGVVFMQPTTEGKAMMAEYADIMDAMQEHPAMHLRYDKHAAVDQAAMNYLWDKHPEQIKAYPCEVYNVTQDFYQHPLRSDAAVLHVKSELRDVLFGVNSRRVQRSGMTIDHPLAQLWQEYYGGSAV